MSRIGQERLTGAPRCATDIVTLRTLALRTLPLVTARTFRHQLLPSAQQGSHRIGAEVKGPAWAWRRRRERAKMGGALSSLGKQKVHLPYGVPSHCRTGFLEATDARKGQLPCAPRGSPSLPIVARHAVKRRASLPARWSGASLLTRTLSTWRVGRSCCAVTPPGRSMRGRAM